MYDYLQDISASSESVISPVPIHSKMRTHNATKLSPFTNASDTTNDYKTEVIETPAALEAFIPEWHYFTKSQSQIHFSQDIERIFLEQQANNAAHGFRIIVLRKSGAIQCIATLIREPERMALQLGILTLGKVRCLRYRLPGGQLLFSSDAHQKHCIEHLLSMAKTREYRLNCVFVEEMLTHHAQALSGNLKGFKLRQMNYPPQGVWDLKISGSYDQFLSNLNKKVRNEIRRKIRKMDAAKTSWEVKRLVRSEDVAELMTAQQYVSSRSWKVKHLAPSRKASQKTNQQYLQAIADLGWLRGYVLYCNGVPRAYSINFQYHNVFYGHEMAYDKNYRQLSPGSVMVYEIIKDLHQERPPEVMSFGFGNSALKKQFCKRSALASDTYLVRRFTFASGIINTQYWLSKLYYHFHQMCILINIDSRLRKIIKC